VWADFERGRSSGSAVQECLYRIFFFSSRRRHTRFSRDWSSDVCSSDLRYLERFIKACLISLLGAVFLAASLAHISFILYVDYFRSEERRVGKECRSRWSPLREDNVRGDEAAMTRASATIRRAATCQTRE